jgi:hypothetical protein
MVQTHVCLNNPTRKLTRYIRQYIVQEPRTALRQRTMQCISAAFWPTPTARPLQRARGFRTRPITRRSARALVVIKLVPQKREV